MGPNPAPSMGQCGCIGQWEHRATARSSLLAPLQTKEGRKETGTRKREQKAEEGGGSGSEGEGRRLPEDPAELASVKISTAVPRAQNKHIGNARALQSRAARAKSRSVPPPAPHPALLDGSSRGVPALLTARQHPAAPASQTQHCHPLLQWRKTNPKGSIGRSIIKTQSASPMLNKYSKLSYPSLEASPPKTKAKSQICL